LREVVANKTVGAGDDDVHWCVPRVRLALKSVQNKGACASKRGLSPVACEMLSEKHR
jgi:hypothetical protein